MKISVAIEKRTLIFIDCGNLRKFFREDLCDALTAKVFCLETFMVYGMQLIIKHSMENAYILVQGISRWHR